MNELLLAVCVFLVAGLVLALIIAYDLSKENARLRGEVRALRGSRELRTLAWAETVAPLIGRASQALADIVHHVHAPKGSVLDVKPYPALIEQLRNAIHDLRLLPKMPPRADVRRAAAEEQA